MVEKSAVHRVPPQSLETMKIVDNLLKAILYECCSPIHIDAVVNSFAYKGAKNDATNDLIAFSQKDPSSSKDLNILSQTSTSFSAVLHYRLAHNIYFGNSGLSVLEREYYAYLISQRGKLRSGAEINFKTKIGKRFILDHGYGTVFGNTAVIGDDCYILGGVILGADCTVTSDVPSNSRVVNKIPDSHII